MKTTKNLNTESKILAAEKLHKKYGKEYAANAWWSYVRLISEPYHIPTYREYGAYSKEFKSLKLI